MVLSMTSMPCAGKVVPYVACGVVPSGVLDVDRDHEVLASRNRFRVRHFRHLEPIQEIVMERDGVHGPGVHEQDRDRPGVHHRVARGPVHLGMDPGVLLDKQSVTEQAPLIEQVVDKIPGEIHQFMDGRLYRWSRHISMVLLGIDSLAEPGRVS
jgi:hypothetical protein